MTATIDRGSATAPVLPPKASTTSPGKRKPGFLRTSNGKKAVMAVSGAVLVLFLIMHMLGNLKIFFGAESFNEYATWLRTVGEPAVPGRTVLTLTEIVLAVSVVAHMWSAVSLARRAMKARPVKYAARRKSRADGYATHTMRYGGVIIALFVIWHLLDLTVGAVNPAGGAATPYDRMVQGFDPSRWWVTLFYILAVVMVGMHLRHGIWSAFQTLGVANRDRNKPLRALAGLVAVLLVAGFLAPPLAITFGVVQ